MPALKKFGNGAVRPRALSWRVIGLIFVAGCIFVLVAMFASFRINDPDTMQYLASGRQILQHGFGETCPFTYGNDRCNVAYAQWSFHVLTYGVFRLAGWLGLNVLQLILTLALFGLLFFYNFSRKVSSWAILLMLLGGSYVAMERFTLRADLLALVWAAALYALLRTAANRLEQNRKITQVFTGSLLVQLAWTNTHGSFPLGWLIVGAFVIESLLEVFQGKYWCHGADQRAIAKVKALCVLLIGIMLISLINPYGLKAAAQPFTFYFGPSQFHSQPEFESPFADNDYTRLSVQLYTWLLVAAGIILLSQLKRLRYADVMIVAISAYLSAAHVRYIALFAVFFTLLMPVYLNYARAAAWAWLARRGLDRSKVTAAVIGAIASLMVGIGGYTMRTVADGSFYMADQRSTRIFGFGLSELAYPVGAASFIKAHDIPGPMFNDYTSGGYLNWVLFPKIKTFIDGHSYTLELLEYYRDIMSGAVPFQTVAGKYHINFVLLNYSYGDSRQLLARLYKDPVWALVYADENSVVFLKESEANQELINRYQVDLLSTRGFTERLIHGRDKAVISNALLNRGSLLTNLGLIPQAAEQLQEAVSADPRNYLAYTSLGAAWYQMGRLDDALAMYMRAERIQSHYAPLQYNLGVYYANGGDLDEATDAFKHALRINPSYQLAQNGLNVIRKAREGASQ